MSLFRRTWLLVAFLVAVAYAVGRHGGLSATLKEQSAWIYHPPSDSLWEVSLAPSGSRWLHGWSEAFFGFSEGEFLDTKAIESVGTLGEYGREHDELRRIMSLADSVDADSLRALHRKQLQARWESGITEREENLKVWKNAELWPRQDLDGYELVPAQWDTLKGLDYPEVSAVDMVIYYMELNNDLTEFVTPREPRLVRGALLVRGQDANTSLYLKGYRHDAMLTDWPRSNWSLFLIFMGLGLWMYVVIIWAGGISQFIALCRNPEVDAAVVERWSGFHLLTLVLAIAGVLLFFALLA